MNPRAASSPQRLARLVAEARRAVPRNRAHAERLVARIVDWLPDRSRRFHELGQALAALESPALYSALGHRSFRALLTTRRLVSPTTAAKLIRIARELPAARALPRPRGRVRPRDASPPPPAPSPCGRGQG